MHSSIARNRRLAGNQLVSLEVDHGEIARSVRANAGARLSASEIRDRIRELQRVSVARIENAFADIGDDQSSGVVRAAMDIHASEALDDVSALIRGARDNEIDPDVFRDDVAKLLNGEPIDYLDYGLSPAQVNGIRTLSSDARRLLVSEANEAIRRVALDAM